MAALPKLSANVLTPKLLDKLVEKDETDINKVIRDLPPVKPITLPSRPSDAFGTLAFLPTEILIATASHLDVLTLTRLAQASMAWKDVVQFNPIYRDLITHVPDVLAALAATGMLAVHPAPVLHHALRSWRCSSCDVHFGGYLFLPTAERACLSCLAENPALRVYDPQSVQQCFGLSDSQLARLPRLRVISGSYKVASYADARVGKSMVAVGAARKLSGGHLRPIEDFECEDSRQPAGDCARTGPVSERPSGPNRRPPGAHMTMTLRTMRDAPLKPPGGDLTLRPRPRYRIDDYLAGVAVVRMPYLPGPQHKPVELDRGRLCRGCLVTQTHYRSGKLPGGVAAAMWPSDLVDGGRRAMEAITTRLWTRDGFEEHLRECYGARLLMRQWGVVEK
ncbi:hypothetical protein MGG_09760 [Pyricularia oryzae 70-15]|uniref:F-box domain-containing protein n=3 Tax=Pyricularia oryzae TaxID=318829 RepID=G4NA25_PYRO7|nr:uncharacterized protein MGG_09760 [Pyricularia oryzae 70-15]EHA51271.1 hypothetical protein MGG_09760 [Pyricularia oryzae 70-15]ELQ35222.1 hypothetical protein OOU_Y34scaffold00720g15 [Pyricularia oryzae Y34]KAI7917423.1 hypothetical protein M9X92_007365 [Pyricularia oryzae]KAI7918291.1 hypothetical protein M0657_007633 [Pyricularia oryzae]